MTVTAARLARTAPTTARTTTTAAITAAPLSVVIPAHDEERSLHRCLENLLDGLGPAEVVVVANGCTDATAEVARSFAGVRVVELAEASKVAALTAGDAEATAFPRIYLDADITMSGATARALAGTLDSESPVVASPRIRFDTSASSWPVRAFYRVYEQLPYIRDGLVGLGVYGMSQAGRTRFGDFPALTTDDLFVQRIFTPGERRTSEGEFTVVVPRDLRNLLRVRTRTASGNAELSEAGADERFARTTSSTAAALLALARRRPWLLPDIAVYTAVTAATRIAARRRTAGWQRDASTR